MNEKTWKSIAIESHVRLRITNAALRLILYKSNIKEKRFDDIISRNNIQIDNNVKNFKELNILE
jgi:hypothetical protein